MKLVVLGAGGIGRGTARRLAAAGHEVTLASRRGSDPGIEGVRPLAADAADRDALTTALTGCAAVVNAVNPRQYTHWERDWPPVAAAVLDAAETTGAGLVTVSNLYAYGRVDAPMTEHTPLRPAGAKGAVRARMWRDALAAHQAGRVRATELRASDHFGAEATPRTSYLNEFVLRPAATGRRIRLLIGDPDATHSWTYLPDIAALAATLATSDQGWGRVWHVPTAPARSVHQVAADVAAITGGPVSKVTLLPRPVRTLLRVVPVVRSLDETKHQLERPFVIDATATTTAFGLTPTPWRTALAETLPALHR